MQKYFLTTEQLNKNIIEGDDVFHITSVMRCRLDERLVVTDEFKEYLVSITSMTKKLVCFEKISEIFSNTELPFEITLFQGYPKGDKLNDIIMHSVELGISKIYPVFTARSIVKMDNEKIVSRLTRFNKIALEAARQSNRVKKPLVVDICDYKKIDFKGYDHLLVCYEDLGKDNENKLLKKVIKEFKANQKIAIFIGPEGGLEKDEVNYLESKGFIAVGLGKRILRTQTASLYVLSTISYEWELKNE